MAQRAEDRVTLDIGKRPACFGKAARTLHRQATPLAVRSHLTHSRSIGQHDRRLVDDLAVRQKHRTVDGILKLAHIARPAVTPKRGTRPVRQRSQRLLIHLRELTCEMIAQGLDEIGRASCRERVWQYVSISVVAVTLNKKKKQEKMH